MVEAQEGDLDRPLVASGISFGLQPESADARSLALEEALRAAVEQALGWLLPAERIVSYYPVLRDQILTEPMAYVQDYQIIHEDAESGLHRVTVQTTLYTEGLKRDLRRLGLFLAASERPRVVVLVAERASPQAQWQWWWRLPASEDREFVFSQALMQLLAARGLIPLDPAVLAIKIPEDPIYQEPLLDNQLGAALARQLGAEVAVLGQASLQIGSAEGKTMASGSLRALRVDDGKILARVSAALDVDSDTDQPQSIAGLAALAERMAPQLVDGVLAPFTVVSQPPRHVTVQVLGVRSYGDLIQIKEYLQRAPGVEEISQMLLQSGAGSFGLILKGNLNGLTDAFAGHDFGSFTTNANLTGEDLVTVTIMSKW